MRTYSIQSFVGPECHWPSKEACSSARSPWGWLNAFLHSHPTVKPLAAWVSKKVALETHASASSYSDWANYSRSRCKWAPLLVWACLPRCWHHRGRLPQPRFEGTRYSSRAIGRTSQGVSIVCRSRAWLWKSCRAQASRYNFSVLARLTSSEWCLLGSFCGSK